MRSPHIALNAQLLSLAPGYRSAGINRYIYNLLVNLAQIEDRYHLTAFLSDENFPPIGHLKRQLSRLPTERPFVRVLWEQFVQPWVLWRQGFALLHAMAFVAPLWSSCPAVVTVYDLSFRRYPDSFRRGNRLYLSMFVRLTGKRAAHFIAISRHTAADMVQLLEIDPTRISVVYCGVEERYRPLPPQEVEAFRRQRALPDRMILYLGTIEPRKNLLHLVRAYRLMLEAWGGGSTGGSQPRLVIAGAKGWMWEEIFRQVEGLALGGQVIFPGYIPGDELPYWYNAAECFVYPSRYEGFGLPVLEAMACGTPVIASNAASLPEVVGEAGLTVAPDDVQALAAAMLQVLGASDLQEALRQRGRRQAGLFSWRRAAEETMGVYDLVLGRGG